MQAVTFAILAVAFAIFIVGFLINDAIRPARYLTTIALLARWGVLILFVVLVVLAAFTAVADAAPRHEKPMTERFALTAATDYWQRRHVEMPCHPTVTVLEQADVDPDAYVYADAESCSIFLTPEAAGNRRDMPLGYCYAIQWGLGFIAGGDVEGISRAPWGCLYRRAFLRYWERGR